MSNSFGAIDQTHDKHIQAGGLIFLLDDINKLFYNKKLLELCDIYVVRISNTYDNCLRNSKPCKNCSNFIKKYNQLLSLFNKIDNNQCLKSFHKHGDNYFYEIDNGLITLKRRIGSNSRYGVIFLSSNKINKTMFATKLMIKDKHNHNEIINLNYVESLSRRASRRRTSSAKREQRI